MLCLGSLLVLGAGCNTPNAPGAADPAKSGDPDRGQSLFQSSECVRCHSFRGMFSTPSAPLLINRIELSVRLGGKSSEELKEAIYDPGHLVGPTDSVAYIEEVTAMMMYAESLSDKDLNDLLAFLTSHPGQQETPTLNTP